MRTYNRWPSNTRLICANRWFLFVLLAGSLLWLLPSRSDASAVTDTPVSRSADWDTRISPDMSAFFTTALRSDISAAGVQEDASRQVPEPFSRSSVSPRARTVLLSNLYRSTQWFFMDLTSRQIESPWRIPSSLRRSTAGSAPILQWKKGVWKPRRYPELFRSLTACTSG